MILSLIQASSCFLVHTHHLHFTGCSIESLYDRFELLDLSRTVSRVPRFTLVHDSSRFEVIILVFRGRCESVILNKIEWGFGVLGFWGFGGTKTN